MISFVIPAYNEAPLIGRTLRAVHEASGALGEPYEVIVADDASTDETAAIARANGARVVRVAHRQIAATRNAGAHAAIGDILIFVDADTVVNEAVVRASIQAIRDGAVGGGSSVRFDGRLPRWAGLVEVALVLFRLSKVAAGCFLFCRRDAFHAVSGFDAALYGAEEVFLSQALKRRGRFVILREAVLTSGRKLRAYLGPELLGCLARLAFGGPRSVQSREALAFWYEDRREDPERAAS